MTNRIKEIISYYGMSNRAFAIKCGLKDNTLINQINGVRELSLATVKAILLSFESVSAEWLLRGVGEMLISENKSDDKNQKRMDLMLDTMSSMQETINLKNKAIFDLESKIKRLENELAMLKNEINNKK